MSETHTRPLLWAIVVTYRRPAALAEMLSKIAEQSRAPDHVIVVDNDSDPDVRRTADAIGAIYLDARDNLGPAGGIALGMKHVLAEAADDEWVVLFDDDDPPPTDDLLETLESFAAECVARDPRTGAVGLSGARYDRRWGVFRRVPDAELRGPVAVDYIGGGQFPLYSCEAIRACGVPDPGFFFGFDDAEYGLRLRRRGFALFVPGELWQAQRMRHGRVGLNTVDLRTGDQTAAWRRYYGVRNTTLIASRYGTAFALIWVAKAGALRGCAALVRARRPLREVLLPLRGSIDGLLGRTGRTVDPGANDKNGATSAMAGIVDPHRKDAR